MKQVAFLRAINVGGRRVRMEHLRSIFTGMGLPDVETFIASGNVIFDWPEPAGNELESRIEAELRAQLGYEVETFLRSDEDLRRIAEFEPFPRAELDVETNVLNVVFLREEPEPDAAAAVHALRTPVDDLRVNGSELYWLRRRALGESLLKEGPLGRALRMPGTNRNITTVRKIVEKYCGK